MKTTCYDKIHKIGLKSNDRVTTIYKRLYRVTKNYKRL